MVLGLFINQTKFELLFIQNTPRLIRRFLSSTTRVKMVLKMGKYLGIFLLILGLIARKIFRI